jgi:spore coat protein A
MTRREFLYAGVANALLLKQSAVPAKALLDPNRLPKFVDCLSIPPRAQQTGFRPDPHDPENKIPYYRLRMSAMATKVHRDLPPTQMWGFESLFPGPTIEARQGEPLLVEWTNDLPHEHLLPIDHSIHGSGPDVPAVRTVVHLHGGRVPPESDGYPERWFQPGGSSLNFYPNIQDATMLWYHDHAMGITRLNIFAGLLGLYVIRDPGEEALDLPTGARELPLVLCDRSLREDGQLYYPVSGNPGQPWVPEFFGEAILVNGKLFPYCEVQPCKYRLRLLNASNSRFYYLSLSNGKSFWQIGSDQGLLPAPVELRRLTIAPAERADLIVDFADCAGREVVLESDIYRILQFRVSMKADSMDGNIPARLRPVPRISESEAVKSRVLTLGGSSDPDDPTVIPAPMLLNNARFYDPVTESPVLDTVEIWNLVNVTDDSHPIHLHLVRFQILDRRPFDIFTYLNDGKLRYTADPVRPDPNEMGWKDTVRADPAMVTRIIVRFEGFTGRYVWHCHVLEHEDNEMMRPYEILPAG